MRGCMQARSEEHTSELQSHLNLVCRLLLEKTTGDRDTRRGAERASRRSVGSASTVCTDEPRCVRSAWAERPCLLAPEPNRFLFFLMQGTPRRSPLFPSPASSI